MDGIITMFERKHMENSNVGAIKNCKTGDVIRFGSYDWFVYARENNIISLLCKNSVKTGTYHSEMLYQR